MDLEDTARNADAAAAPNYGGGLLTRSGSNGVDVVGGRDGNTLVVLRHDSPSDTAKLVPTSDNQPNHGPKSFPCAETLSEIHFGGEAEAKAVLDSGVHCPATNGNPELGGGGDRAAERYSDSKSIGPEVSKGLDVQISKAESVADVGSKDKTGLPQQQIEPHTPQELSEPNAIKPGAATSLAEGARPVQPVDLVVSAQSPMGNHDKSSAIAAQPPSGNGGSARLLTPGKSEPEVHLSAEVLHEPSDTSGMHSLDTDVRVGTYVGDTDVEGRRHGHGTCGFTAGGRYTGEWWEGKMHGHGKYEFPWGDSYVGAFSDGKRQGIGEYSYASGNKYIGHFEDNKRHGLGQYSYISGAKYNGAFAFDQRHGYGKYTFANGDVYQGDYIRGQMHGEGKLIQCDGSIFEGLWKDGKMHGKGCFTFASGSKYIGEYAEGEMHGQGVYSFSNGDIYRGQYEKGFMSKGTFLFANGDRYHGEFRNGKMHGFGRFEGAEGDMYEGEFEMDVKHGTGIMQMNSGARFEGCFRKGKKHGAGRYCTPDGTWYEAEWTDGKRAKSKKLSDAPHAGRGSISQEDSLLLPDAKDRTMATTSTPYTSPQIQKATNRQVAPRSCARVPRPPSSHDQYTIAESGVYIEGRKAPRKAPIFRQRYTTTLPPDKTLGRYRGGNYDTASGALGNGVQCSSPRSVGTASGRHGIPSHLMQLLAIESHAARDRLPPHAPHSSTPATNNMDYRHPTQTGTARSSPARPGSAPAFRGADYDYRLRPVASEQHAPRDPSRAASSAIQSQTSHWPCPYPEPQSRGNSIQPSPGSRRQKGHVPMPLEPRAAPANDPELSGWLRSDRYRPNQPLSNTGDELQAHPIGLSPQLELMRVEEATRTDTWHPGIPRPTWAKQRPSGAVVEPRHIAEQKPVYWRMRPYNRSFRANLHSVADSLP